ncbi:hypothetical protein MNEG_13504 [Monoraphidium neglectum]|uniref:Uncharacterized protein n=1 Tax=Monoraphidium neglectum TaxID=145388 RepID=A0A0D2J3C2_9CHLO|nr:hypothetical protein MNEG_13504 [Monoraphidium neglectum]KIY94457.1 hypothetical protein MNEG_13504 [Monoraphidium neglectum]|eukprot:XP_013893477.1 hypothetical protein MNEG_13504 [Monoraphidium neglectum]
MELRSRSIPPSPEQKPARSRGAGHADNAAAAQGLPSPSSWPMLTADPAAALEGVPDIPFSQLCHEGSKVTSKNLLNKIWRYTIVPTKNLYLPFMFSGLPTNYLMGARAHAAAEHGAFSSGVRMRMRSWWHA